MKCCIGIEDGKIAAIKKVLKGARHYDFGEKVILPGGIDGRVRFYKPQPANSEDFQSGTTAAAHGGITCIIDMCDSRPPVLSFDALWDKIHYCRRRALIDFGSYVYATPLTAKEKLLAAAAGFYLEYPGISAQSPITTEATFEASISRLASLNTLLTLHSEEPAMLAFQAEEASSASEFNQHRPVKLEIKGVEHALELLSKGPLNITGITSIKTVEQIQAFNAQYRSRRERLPKDHVPSLEKITTEITPHHLLLNTDTIKGSIWRARPPVRGPEDQTALFSCFARGEIDMVVSDHRAVTTDMGDEDGLNYQIGFPGVETMVPLLLSLVRQDRLTLARVVETAASHPAMRFGLPKGMIEPGYDADLMVIDFREQALLRPEMLMTKCGWTPFENFPVIFPIMTMARGEVVMEGHTIVADHGRGRSVPDPSI